MTRTLIQYDTDNIREWLVDSQDGLAVLASGTRGWMPKAAECKASGWYTVVRSENIAK
jgi:hypothetical protein